MKQKLIKARDLVEKYSQSHLLAFYNELNETEKENLLNQILSIDFELVKNLYKHRNDAALNTDGHEITPIKCESKADLPQDLYKELRNTGINEIKKGGLAVVTMAGGQGTRLGHDGPKGTYDIGLPSHKSLFELQCDHLKDSQAETGVATPWYIMTSRENNSATVSFFEENNYFDYGKNNIMFFEQSMLPMIDTEGRILLSEKHLIKEGPDGHGGIFGALKKSGAVTEMEKRGIRWVFICGIDNCLMEPTDPVFLGYTIKSGYLASSKPIIKRSPNEKVGIFCKMDGRPYVIEYTEMTDELANLKDADGNYVYGDAHILGNMFNINFIKEIGDKGFPYHTAFKKAPFTDTAGNLVSPPEPNAYKFELFLFDAFNLLNDMALLRVRRDDEFAPVKNREGEDSPETARQLYLALKDRSTK